MHALAIHRADKQADGAHHDDRVGGFDGDNDVVKLLLAAEAEELHAGLGHALGCIAKARHDAVREGAVVDADTDGGAMCAAEAEEGDEALADLADALGEVVVGVVGAEGACAIDVVARIDAHFLHKLRGHVGGFRVEVDVGHEGRVAPLLVQSFTDNAEVTGLAYALGGEADVFGAGACHADRLNDGRIRVHGRYVGHGLDAYGVIPAQRGVTNGDYRGRSSFQFVLNLNWTLANSSLALTIFFLSPSL